MEAAGRRDPPPGGEGAWGVADGLESLLLAIDAFLVQHHCRGGWARGMHVNCVIAPVFIFARGRLARALAATAPGGAHSSSGADCGVHKKMKKFFCEKHQSKIFVDSAFEVGLHEFLTKSSQSSLIDSAPRGHRAAIDHQGATRQ